MTYKEKVLTIMPAACIPTSFGGVLGCPGHYEFMSDGPVCGRKNCIGCGTVECEKCWNTEMPVEKKAEAESEYKPSESILEFLDKARDRGDMTIRVSVNTVNNDIIDLMVYPSEPEEEEFTSFQEDMMFVLNDMTDAQAEFAVEYLQKKYNLKPKQDVVKHGYWREIKYHTDEKGVPSLVEDGIKAYGIVNVYCPASKRVYSAFWSDLKSAWVIAGTNSAGRLVVLPHEPTHWMPVPNAPKGE